MDENEILARLKENLNADNIALVSRDGIPMAAHTSEGVSADTFSIMCATILGAGETANQELNKGETDMILLESAGSRVAIAGAGNRALLVLSVPKETDTDQILDEVVKASVELGKVI